MAPRPSPGSTEDFSGVNRAGASMSLCLLKPPEMNCRDEPELILESRRGCGDTSETRDESPDLRACHSKCPTASGGGTLHSRARPEKWERWCWGILGREFQPLWRFQVVQPMLDPVSSGKSVQSSVMPGGSALGARACLELLCRAWCGSGLKVTIV